MENQWKENKSARKTFPSKGTRNTAFFIMVCAAAGGGMRGNMKDFYKL